MVQALVAHEAGGSLRVEEVTLRPLGEHDVRVQVAVFGAAPLRPVDGRRHAAPVVPARAGARSVRCRAWGRTHQAGVEVGTRVVLNWAVPCRTCWHCTHGEPWLCSTIEGTTGTPGGTLADGTPFHACLGLGAMAEEVVCPADAVLPIPDGVPLEEAALLGCAVLTGVGAASDAARVRPGDSVLVIGLGGVGLCAVLGARLAGAARIIAVDTAPAKESLARSAGATDFLEAAPDLHKQVRRLTEGRGDDRALELGPARPRRSAPRGRRYVAAAPAWSSASAPRTNRSPSAPWSCSTSPAP